jgi:glycosyltransferase involved in cell wall biosynthesis
MKIIFNSYFLSGEKAGIGHYSLNILNALKQVDDNLRIDEISNKYGLNKLIFEQIYLPIYLLLKRPDIYFSPSIVLPFISLSPSVVVVYDLVFKIFPKYYRGLINIFYLKMFFKRSLINAKKIIAISESTKRELVNIYNIPEEKIKVIHLAAAKEYRLYEDKDQLAKIREKYKLPKKYLLYVGTIEARKNVKGIIRAYFALPDKIRFSTKLVLCGKKGWGVGDLEKRLADHQEKDSVIFLDYVDGTDLPLIYNLASLFVYPSFYEGFGLPILEAMACGVPVITSNCSSMPEVSGDAALLVDPNNISEISDKMKDVLEHSELAMELRSKGMERAKMFSWERAGKETFELLEKVKK